VESVVVCIRRRVGRTNREIFQPTRRKRVGFVFYAKPEPSDAAGQVQNSRELHLSELHL
jgi:hypothetical protein